MSISKRCPDCAIRHRGGRCHPLPVWPTKPLLERCGGLKVLYEALGWSANRGAVPDMISDATADRWAVRCGFHPDQVWPGWSEAGLTLRDRRFLDGNGWRQAWLWQEAQRAEQVAS